MSDIFGATYRQYLAYECLLLNHKRKLQHSCVRFYIHIFKSFDEYQTILQKRTTKYKRALNNSKEKVMIIVKDKKCAWVYM